MKTMKMSSSIIALVILFLGTTALAEKFDRMSKCYENPMAQDAEDERADLEVFVINQEVSGETSPKLVVGKKTPGSISINIWGDALSSLCTAEVTKINEDKILVQVLGCPAGNNFHFELDDGFEGENVKPSEVDETTYTCFEN